MGVDFRLERCLLVLEDADTIFETGGVTLGRVEGSFECREALIFRVEGVFEGGDPLGFVFEPGLESNETLSLLLEIGCEVADAVVFCLEFVLEAVIRSRTASSSAASVCRVGASGPDWSGVVLISTMVAKYQLAMQLWVTAIARVTGQSRYRLWAGRCHGSSSPCWLALGSGAAPTGPQTVVTAPSV